MNLKDSIYEFFSKDQGCLWTQSDLVAKFNVAQGAISNAINKLVRQGKVMVTPVELGDRPDLKIYEAV